MKGERHSRGRASLLLLWPLETHHQMVGWCCDSKEYIGFPQRDTFTTNTRLSIVKLKWKVLFLNEISTMWEMAHLLWQNDCWHESNFHFLYWFFQNWQIAWCFEINSKMSEFLQFEKHSRAVSSPCNVWNKIMQGCLKKKTVFYISSGKKTPWRCSASEIPTYLTAFFKVLHKTVSDSRRKCVRKSGSTSLWVVKIVPQKKEAHHGDCIWL